jgi:hypothetical protein
LKFLRKIASGGGERGFEGFFGAAAAAASSAGPFLLFVV